MGIWCHAICVNDSIGYHKVDEGRNRTMFKPDSSLMQGIDEWIEKNKEAFVKDLDRLVAIPSISEKGDDTLERTARRCWTR